ncbi:peptidoglycan editing factor PgeF [Rudanella paleaurantiibacter]|uniref:Purine nucleoside phosphorylase n=1 Tax=Rudanella paleaurantiibacter TaxID=2614655 RepID=A0A7J5TU35_9BACT|nr:peptidoglycan editing factor PgeF [Rudanella paleaurantiibacter]KAB7727515.1 peptidoglycan editing factor PgeF [Rudanella paleaurantiibacter]
MFSTSEKPLFRAPALFSSFSTLIAAESTRHGGVSPAPYQSLNLGLNTADNPRFVEENRLRFFSALGINPERVATSHQVHGKEILEATQPGRYDGYDALMTNQPDLYVAVSIADCVPILVYDGKNKAVAAIHAGWKGTVAELVRLTLETMQQQYGTRPGDCYAYVGTCIDETSFEVGPEVAEKFAPEFKRVDEFTQRTFVNLRSANTRQLTNFGIPTAQIALSTYSTVLNNEDYFSHRYENGQTGRLMAVIGLKS